MKRRIRRYLALNPGDKRLFAKAYLSLSLIDLMLQLFGFERTLRFLSRRALLHKVERVPDRNEISQAKAMASVVAIAGRYTPLDGSCLRQALLLFYLLRRKGLSPEVRIGVDKKKAFAAHAWVELAGHCLDLQPDPKARFTPMERISR